MSEQVWFSAGKKYAGVRFRKHSTRKHGVSYDKYFMIRYQNNGKRIEEPVGWASSGWTITKVADLRGEILRNIRKGNGYQSLHAQREAKKHADEQKKLKKIQEQAKNLTVSSFFYDLYMQDFKNSQKKSLSSEETKFRLHIEPIIGKLRMWDLGFKNADAVRRATLKKGLAPRTIEYCLTILHRMIVIAKRLDKFPREQINPASAEAGIERQRYDNARKRIFTLEQIEEIISRCDSTSSHGDDLPLMIRMSFQCGLRAGDLWKIKWQHISEDLNTINIIAPKNGKDRNIAIPENIQQELFGIGRGRNSDFLFKKPHTLNQPVKEVPWLFRKIIKDMELNEGITDKKMSLCFHSLLHTASTKLAEAGVGAEERQKFRGHKSIAMAQRYDHSEPDHKKIQNVLNPTLKQPAKIVFIGGRHV